MKVYSVEHKYDNGESYEDYREYTDVKLFSTYERANTFFWERVISDYKGKYLMHEWELDTNEKKLLDESEYIACKPYDPFDDYYEDDDYQECEDNYQQVDKETIEDYLWSMPIFEEQIAEEEWLKHKGENYEVLHQIEEDQLEDALAELEEMAKSL